MIKTVSTHQSEDDIRNEDILIYLNGKILPKNEAVVSVYDSGFMLGDGVWEGLRLYNNRWAFCDEHIDRLFEAALAIDLDIGLSKSDVIDALIKTQSSNDMVNNAHARLMITRGPKKRPFQHPGLSQDDGLISDFCFVFCFIFLSLAKPLNPRDFIILRE